MDQSSAPQVSGNAVSSPSPIPAPSVPVGPTVVVSSAATAVPVTAPNVVAAPVNTQNVAQNPVTASMPTTNYTYAGFFRRYFAIMIDGVILGIINGVLGFGIGFIGGMILGKELQALILLCSYGVSIVIMLIYYLYFIGTKGQTPGKMALGIKVIKTDGNLRVGYLSAFLREIIGKIISAMIFCLGYLWMLWDSKKQTWHDKIANTIVIRV